MFMYNLEEFILWKPAISQLCVIIHKINKVPRIDNCDLMVSAHSNINVQLINYCILIAKYYIQILRKNRINFYDHLVWLKQKL